MADEKKSVLRFRGKLFGFLFLFFFIISSNVEVDASIVNEWNESLLDVIRDESRAPGYASRALAIVHLGGWKAHYLVEGRLEAFDVDESIKKILLEYATIYSLNKSATLLFPGKRVLFDKLLESQISRLSLVSIDQSLKSEVETIGQGAAIEIVHSRSNDRAATRLTFVPSKKPGQWQRTPPNFRPPELSHWHKVHPFILDAPDQFRPPPPPNWKSPSFQKELARIEQIGGQEKSSERTRTDELIAEFWSCFSYTSTPAGHWNAILQSIVLKESYDLKTTHRSFAILNIILADAAIAAWDCKYHYRYWRPVQAIAHIKSEDLKKATWLPFLETPPHPEYVSGHSTFAGAGARALVFLTGSDNYTFTTKSDSLKGVTRSFNSFSQCAHEMGLSRIFGGIHYSFSNTEGLKLGERVADHALTCLKKFNLQFD